MLVFLLGWIAMLVTFLILFIKELFV